MIGICVNLYYPFEEERIIRFHPNPGTKLAPNKKPTLKNLSKWLVFRVGPVGIEPTTP